MKHLHLDEWCFFVAFCFRWGFGVGRTKNPTAWKKELSESSHSWKKALLTESAQISSRNKPRTHLCLVMSVQCSLRIEASEGSNGEPSSFVDWLHFCWLVNSLAFVLWECAAAYVYLSIALVCDCDTPLKRNTLICHVSQWADLAKELLQGPFALHSAPTFFTDFHHSVHFSPLI